MSLQALVDRGFAIKAEMAKLKTELDEIEEKLQKAGLAGEHHELKDADREGRRFLARGSKKILPVVFTADKIVGSFKKNSDVHTRIAALAHGHLASFYAETITFENVHKDGKAFRTAADHILGKTFAPPFITASLSVDKHGIPKSDVKIEWDKAEEIVAK